MTQAPRVAAVIPARMASSRYPGKPLVPIMGLPMIEHVRRRVALADWIHEAVVATCDDEIVEVVSRAGGRAIMTADTHQDAVDRVEEASRSLNADIILIVQGDEPLVRMETVEPILRPFVEDSSVNCVSLLSVIDEPADFASRDVVKASVDLTGEVLYFSRAPIPFARDGTWRPALRQTGISAFRRAYLPRYAAMQPTPLELTEGVGFLRMLENGHKVLGVIITERTLGVDRPEDVAPIERALREDPTEAALFARITDR